METDGKAYEVVCPAAAPESSKRKADAMGPEMEMTLKKRTLILGEEEESEDDQVFALIEMNVECHEFRSLDFVI